MGVRSGDAFGGGLPGPEILVAVTLLGLLSTFFLPKIFHQREKAKISQVREAVSILEETYTQSRGVYGLQEYTHLFDNTAAQMNATFQGETYVADPGAPLYQALDNHGNPHPCTVRSDSQGWILLHNGLLISGLSSQSQLGDGTDRDLAGTTEYDIFVLCVDANGAKGPNIEGSDVFWGNFQHNDHGSAFRWGRGQRWPWGSNGAYLMQEDGYSNLANPAGSDIADLLKKR